MTDRGHEAAKDREIQRPVDVEDDESRNSPSGAPGNDTPTPAAGFNPQILRRPSRQVTDPNEDLTEDPLPVPVNVELDARFESGVPIPDLPHPSLDASLKSEAFDVIRGLILDGAATPQQELQVNDEAEEDLLPSEEEEESEDGQGQGLFAVDNLRFFLGNIRFEDVKMT